MTPDPWPAGRPSARSTVTCTTAGPTRSNACTTWAEYGSSSVGAPRVAPEDTASSGMATCPLAAHMGNPAAPVHPVIRLGCAPGQPADAAAAAGGADCGHARDT